MANLDIIRIRGKDYMYLIRKLENGGNQTYLEITVSGDLVQEYLTDD